MPRDLPTVVQLAIRFEEESRDFYLQVGDKLQDGPIAGAARALAAEEEAHGEQIGQTLGQAGADAAIPYRRMERVQENIFRNVPDSVLRKLLKADSVEDILVFALEREYQSLTAYAAWSALLDRPELKDFFAELARQEKGHIATLESLL